MRAEHRNCWTSFTLRLTGLHVHWGCLDFIYVDDVWPSFTSGISGLIDLGDVRTSFTLGMSGLRLPHPDTLHGMSGHHLPCGWLDLIYLRGQSPLARDQSPLGRDQSPLAQSQEAAAG